MKVLSFAPYQNWSVHHQLDLTLLRALRLRGADTAIVTCDGTLLAGTCYALTISQEGAWLRDCQTCASKGKTEAASAAGRQITMGDYLTVADYEVVSAWMEQMVGKNPAQVVYADWDIGAWVVGTVHTHLKSVKEESGEFRETFFKYCRSGLLCALAIDRILDAEKPDHLVLFGGRDSPYRITYELARRKGIRVLYHERGYMDDSFVVADNETVFDKAFKITPPLDEWMSAPLSRTQCDFARNYLLLREHGRGMNWPTYLGNIVDAASTWTTLGIPPDAVICGLFTSTPYEIESFLHLGSSKQRLFMENMLSAFSGRSEWLVIRVHPNTAGGTVESTDRESIQYFAELQRRAPANVVVIMPDEEFNSYALLHVVSVVLAPFSSVAYEGAGRGLPAAVMGSWMALACIAKLDAVDVQSLTGLLDRFFQMKTGEVETLRRAYRFVYLLTSRMCLKFASFGFRHHHAAEQRFFSDEDLARGRDPSLDRLCDHVLAGGPIYEPCKIIDGQEEEEFLEQESLRLAQQRRRTSEVTRRQMAMKLSAPVTVLSLGSRRAPGDSNAALDEGVVTADWRLALPDLLDQMPTPYAAFWMPGVEHLSRFHQSLAEALQRDPVARIGARHGAWIAAADGTICDEVLSVRTRAGWNSEETWQSQSPWRFLCLGIYRAGPMAEWLRRHGNDTAAEFAAAIRELLLSPDMLAPARPMAVFHPENPVASVS